MISLAASLFSAFLAVLGKQWLGRYESTDLRETVIERGQNRQQKLDGIVTWRFHRVMQSLPLMLQFALFFLGYAIPLSLVDVNTVISYIAFCLTSVGVFFYISVIVAGAVFKNCPYQTATSHFLRHLRPKFPGIVHSLEMDGRRFVSAVQPAVQDPEPARNLRCVSWVLWTSLDKTIHLSSLRYLALMGNLSGIDPTLILNCFYIFAGCVSLHDNTVVITQGQEQLAAVSAQCFFDILMHLRTTGYWTSNVMGDLRRRYNRVFPFPTNFSGLPFPGMMVLIDAQINGRYDHFTSEWDNYNPLGEEDVMFARHMVQAVEVEYRQHKEVPDWALNFAHHSLSLDPPPPARVVADSLKLAAIDLGCDVSAIVASQARCVHIASVFMFLTRT